MIDPAGGGADTGTEPPALRRAGATVFAVGVVALGLLHVGFGDALTRMLPVLPEGVGGRPLPPRPMGALVAVAGALLLTRWARGAAAVLAAVLLLPVLALHLPRAMASGQLAGEWLNVLKWLALASGPLLVAAGAGPAPTADGAVGRLRTDRVPTRGRSTERLPAGRLPTDRFLTGRPLTDRLLAGGAAAAPWLMGAFMVLSGILHVRQAEFVALLMPAWFPWKPFWVHFTAVTLAAGGVGLVIPKVARPAAYLTSLMILGFFFLVHVPRMLADPGGPVGWSEMAEAAAFSAMALVMATAGAARTDVPAPEPAGGVVEPAAP